MSPLPEDKQLRFVKQEDRSPMSPQLARRVAIVGTMTLAIFAILFFRLWFLQVLSGDQYAAAASVNYVRNLEIAAPRGEILDSSGQILAKSQRAYAVEISPPSLPVPLTDKNLAHPPQPDAQLYDRVAGVVGLPTKREKCPVDGHGVLHVSQIACEVDQGYVQLPYAEATVATDITSQQLWYLSERQGSFPGVSVQQIYQRSYPFKDIASQLLGIVSRITPGRSSQRYFAGVSQNDSVGQSGLEASYDRYLRGVDGAEKVKVDALGNFDGYLSETPADRRRQPQAVAQRAARSGRPAVASGVDRLELSGERGRVRGDEPRQRTDLRDGLAPELRRERVHQARPDRRVRGAVRSELGRSAGEPRLSERRADRVDVQADHRDRGARERGLDDRRDIR